MVAIAYYVVVGLTNYAAYVVVGLTKNAAYAFAVFICLL
jgi:hypothetical protein